MASCSTTSDVNRRRALSVGGSILALTILLLLIDPILLFLPQFLIQSALMLSVFLPFCGVSGPLLRHLLL